MRSVAMLLALSNEHMKIQVPFRSAIFMALIVLCAFAGPGLAQAETLTLGTPVSEFQNSYGYNINGNNAGHIVIDGSTSATGGTATVTLTDGAATQVTGTGAIGGDGTYSVAVNATSLADGIITVTVHADDGSGNTGDSSPVTLKKDATPPMVDNLTISPPAGQTTVKNGDAMHVTGTLNGTGSSPLGGGSETALLHQYDANGNEVGSPMDIIGDFEQHSAFTLNLHPSAASIQATLRMLDRAGNAGTTASNIVLVGDGIASPPPVVTITGIPVGTTDITTQTFTVTSDTSGSTFTCTLDSVSVDCSSGSYTATGLTDGSHTFTAAANAGGQTGTASGTFTINIAPTATVAYSTTALTGGDVTATMTASKPVTITNNGASDSYTFTSNGSFTFEFEDGAGGTGSVIATVSNIDKTQPVITAPADQTFEATGAQTTPALTAATATDDNGTPTITHAPSSFSLGTTQVTWTATDTVGNQSTATSQVTITDSTAPAITGTPSDITAEATSTNGASVTFSAPTTSDLVDGFVSVSCDKVSGSTFALGDTTVTCSAEDAAHNSASAHFKVTVQDTTAPVVTITAPTDGSTIGQTVSPSFSVTDDTNTTSACTLDGNTIDCTAQMTGLAASSHTFVVQATDQGGNSASATSTFTVSIPATTPAPSNSGGGGGGGSNSSSSSQTSVSTLAPELTSTPTPVTPTAQPTPTPTGEVLGASTYNFAQLLQLGSTGNDVTQLQMTLTQEGVYSGPITGFFGNLTRAGVIAYQAKYGIDQLGIVGPMTRAQLNTGTASAEQASTTTSFTFTQQLSVGSHGAEVTQLQTVLIALNLLPSPPTGYYGPLTEQAVMQYQAQHGIERTGTVGPLTRAQLNQH